VKMFDDGKTRMIGLPYGDKNYDDMLSRFHLVPERNGRTDRFAVSISRVSMLTRDKHEKGAKKIKKLMWQGSVSDRVLVIGLLYNYCLR